MHAVVLVISFVLPIALIALASSQDSGRAPGPDAGAGPPKPAPEQSRLEVLVGAWDAEVEMAGQTSKGVETCRMGLGGFWLITEFDGSFMGAPFQGHGIAGFDAAKGRIVTVWADSTGSPLTVSEGSFAADGKRFVADSSGVDMSGKPARFRHVTTLEGRDRRTFEVFQVGQAGDELAMRIRYKRRAGK